MQWSRPYVHAWIHCSTDITEVMHAVTLDFTEVFQTTSQYSFSIRRKHGEGVRFTPRVRAVSPGGDGRGQVLRPALDYFIKVRDKLAKSHKQC